MAKSYRIMVVDDDHISSALLKKILVVEWLDVFMASSGEQCLLDVESCRPDVILLDILMPGIDGFETCRQLKSNANFCEIPIIFITSLDLRENIAKGFELGASDYIMKPFHPTEVIARTKAVLVTQSLIKDKTNLIRANTALISRLDKMLKEFDLPNKIENMRNELSVVSDSILDRLEELKKGYDHAFFILSQLEESLKLEGKLNQFKTEIHDILLSINKQIDALRTGFNNAIAMLNSVDLSFQFADRVNQQMIEIAKLIQKLHNIMKEQGPETAPEEGTSSASVLVGKAKQEEIDDLLESLEM